MAADPARQIHETRWPRRAVRLAPAREHGRHQGTLRESVHHVGEQQFLVLLLVVQPQLDEVGHVFFPLGEQPGHRLVHVAAIGADLLRAGPGDQAARRARLPRADGFVVAVEQEAELGIERRVARQVADRARTARRTRSCGRGATSQATRPAWTGRTGPRRSAPQRAAPCGRARRDNAPPSRKPFRDRSCAVPLPMKGIGDGGSSECRDGEKPGEPISCRRAGRRRRRGRGGYRRARPARGQRRR